MTMPTFGAGQRVYASQLNQMARQIDSLTAPGYIPWTPTWTTSGAAPALGNGTLVGDYRRSANSDEVRVRFQLTMGSTTTFGTGTYFIGNLPFAPNAATIGKTVGSLYILDSGTLDKIGGFKFEDLTKITPVSATLGVVTNTIPQTWAVNDILRGDFVYQPA
jgi:hypothetical protein